MSNKMNRSEVMATLAKLEKRWPSDLKLFASSSGTLMLLQSDTNEIVEYYAIDCDGGCIGIETGEDGVERLAYA